MQSMKKQLFQGKFGHSPFTDRKRMRWGNLDLYYTKTNFYFNK